MNVSKFLKNGTLIAASTAFCVFAEVKIERGALDFNLASASAQELITPKLDGCKTPPAKRKLKALPQKFFKKVEKVDALINPEVDEDTGKGPEPDYKAAWPMLKKLVDRCDDCSAYEWAQLYQRAAIVQYNMDNIPGAIDYFQKVISKSPDIPLSLETQLLYQIAQLLTAEEKYQEALNYFGKWEAMCPTVVPNNYFYFRAQAYFQMGNKNQALKEIQRAIKFARDNGEVPQEPWLKMEFAIYYDKEDFKNAERVAEEIAVQYTSNRAVAQLASVYGTNNKIERQAALLDALFQANALTREGEYKNLAFTYLEKDAPYLASRVLKKGFDKKAIERSSRNLNVYSASLAQSLELEDAMPIMEEAASKAEDGKLYASLAAVYLNAEKYNKSIDAGNKALKKGVERKGEVYVFMGTAYMHMEKFDDALKTLQKVDKKDSSYGYVNTLTRYIKSEMKRIEGLESAKANL